MRQYEILITESAANDLRQITDHVAVQLQDPVSARMLSDRLKHSMMSLATMPYRHVLVVDHRLAALGIRKLPIDGYLVFYAISEGDETVNVLRVLHGRRDWTRLL
ncbi:MAG: type II toxin-antitoxin system RelE/ParE family toxin [Firmicutes bacterium]|nr:type II toxin-antitoxin system RelE/ParE family toxin [Bacillota bacterium]